MTFTTRSRAALASAALLLAALAPTVPANASPANGELCSVQTIDGEIVASVYAYPVSTSNHATRAQLARAGQWCTNQVNTPGFVAADRNFDSWTGQLLVCFIHFSSEPVVVGIFADPISTDAVTTAEDDCNQVAGGNQYVISWYPNGSKTTPAAAG